VAASGEESRRTTPVRRHGFRTRSLGRLRRAASGPRPASARIRRRRERWRRADGRDRRRRLRWLAGFFIRFVAGIGVSAQPRGGSASLLECGQQGKIVGPCPLELESSRLRPTSFGYGAGLCNGVEREQCRAEIDPCRRQVELITARRQLGDQGPAGRDGRASVPGSKLRVDQIGHADRLIGSVVHSSETFARQAQACGVVAVKSRKHRLDILAQHQVARHRSRAFEGPHLCQRRARGIQLVVVCNRIPQEAEGCVEIASIAGRTFVLTGQRQCMFGGCAASLTPPRVKPGSGYGQPAEHAQVRRRLGVEQGSACIGVRQPLADQCAGQYTRQDGGDLQSQRRGAMLPGESGARVVAIGREIALESGRIRAGHVRVPGFCEQARDRVGRAQLRRLDLTLSGQPFQCEGLRRLEQAIARAGVVVARQHGDQRAVDQHVERIEHRPGVDSLLVGSDLLRHLQGAAADHHSQAAEHGLLRFVEKPVAPLERRAQSLLACRRRAVAVSRQQPQPVAHRACEAVNAEHRGACRGELDGQRQAVDRVADRHHRRQVGIGERKAGVGRLRAVDEQCHCAAGKGVIDAGAGRRQIERG
jgi:hypothetical protein